MDMERFENAIMSYIEMKINIRISNHIRILFQQKSKKTDRFI